MAEMRSWVEMRTWIERRLADETGDDVAAWSQRIRETGLAYAANA